MTLFDVVTRKLKSIIPDEYLRNDDYKRGFLDGYFSVRNGYYFYSVAKNSNVGIITLLEQPEEFIRGYVDGIRDSIEAIQLDNDQLVYQDRTANNNYLRGYSEGECSVSEGMWFYAIFKHRSNKIQTLLELDSSFVEGYLDGIKNSIIKKKHETRSKKSS